MKRLARSIEGMLLLGGAILLGVWAFAIVHQRVLASFDRATFDGAEARGIGAPLARGLQPRAGARTAQVATGEARSALGRSETSSAWVAAYLVNAAPLAAERLALLEIPAIDLDVVVLQGTDRFTLNRGVGHIEGTAAPGSDGNAGIAGHRDGFFHGLERVKAGDMIRITLPGGERTIEYRIEWMRVVRPQDVWVLDSTGQPSLTLVTCHPFRFVGQAPDRYVVRAVALGDFASRNQPTQPRGGPASPARLANAGPGREH
jgi:LPXTG-site transpeptidase (sortase) family protein